MGMTAKSGLLGLALLIGLGALIWVKPSANGPEVVVYTSVDSRYAENLAKRFTRDTGIRVLLRTDSEASKTTDMVNRLRLLKARPDGDVFWNSELSGTLLLAQDGVLEKYSSPESASIPDAFKDPDGWWTGFGLRARVLIYNTNQVQEHEVPTSLEALTDPKWRGRFCMARPLFGTTRSHMVSLVAELGEDQGLALLRRIKENATAGSSKRWIVDGNAAVRDRVAEGTFALGLTDTDDVYSAMDRKKPVGISFIEQAPKLGWPGVYLIPNTVSLIRNGPHPKQAKRFIDFLLSPKTEAWLAKQGARQIPVRADVQVPTGYKKLSDLNPARHSLPKLVKNIESLSEKVDQLFRSE